MIRTTPQQCAGTGELLTIEVHRDIAALRELWCAFQKHALGGPHDTWEWNNAWTSTAGKSREPLIAVGLDATGNVVFLLPLTIRKRAGCAVLEWLSAEQGNYSSGLFHPTAWQSEEYPRGQALMDQLITALPRVDAIHLADQPVRIGEALNPLAGLPGLETASAGHAFPLSPDWEAHFNEKFSSRQKSKIRRGERQLGEQGTIHFDVSEQGPDRSQAMDDIIAEKRDWFAERGIPDFFAQADMRDFFHALVHIPDSGSGPTTRIYTLRVNDETVATNMGLIFQNKFYGLMASTTSGPLRRHGPGRLLFRRLVEHLANEGIEMIDCGAGEDEDKLRWCTQQRERLHAIVPVSAKGHVYTAALKSKLRAKFHIKHNPLLWNMAKRLRQWKAAIKPPRPSLEGNPAGSPAPGLQA